MTSSGGTNHTGWTLDDQILDDPWPLITYARSVVAAIDTYNDKLREYTLTSPDEVPAWHNETTMPLHSSFLDYKRRRLDAEDVIEEYYPYFDAKGRYFKRGLKGVVRDLHYFDNDIRACRLAAPEDAKLFRLERRASELASRMEDQVREMTDQMQRLDRQHQSRASDPEFDYDVNTADTEFLLSITRARISAVTYPLGQFVQKDHTSSIVEDDGLYKDKREKAETLYKLRKGMELVSKGGASVHDSWDKLVSIMKNNARLFGGTLRPPKNKRRVGRIEFIPDKSQELIHEIKKVESDLEQLEVWDLQTLQTFERMTKKLTTEMEKLEKPLNVLRQTYTDYINFGWAQVAKRAGKMDEESSPVNPDRQDEPQQVSAQRVPAIAVDVPKNKTAVQNQDQPNRFKPENWAAETFDFSSPKGPLIKPQPAKVKQATWHVPKSTMFGSATPETKNDSQTDDPDQYLRSPFSEQLTRPLILPNQTLPAPTAETTKVPVPNRQEKIDVSARQEKPKVDILKQATPKQVMRQQAAPKQVMPKQPELKQGTRKQAALSSLNTPPNLKDLPVQSDATGATPKPDGPNQNKSIHFLPQPLVDTPTSKNAPHPDQSERVTPNHSTPQQASPYQASPNQALPNQASPYQASPHQASPHQASPHQASPNQASPKPVAIKPPNMHLARAASVKKKQNKKLPLPLAQDAHMAVELTTQGVHDVEAIENSLKARRGP